MFVLHAASPTHRYNICVHSVLNIIVHPFVYDVHAVHADGVALSHTYFEYDKLRLSAPYNVIVQFAVYVAHAGDALTVGFVKSMFAAFDVCDVVLHNHAALHIFGFAIVHVAHDHCPIVHHVLCDVGHDTVSV